MTKVYLERGTKRVFACAYDWPGWCRSAKDDEGALSALADYAERYGAIAEAAGLRFPKTASNFHVVDRVKGDSTTDFGAPHVVAPLDKKPFTAAQAKKSVAILEASWAAWDELIAHAPATLRKGPRGGGRDRDQVVEHVESAVIAYSRKLGIRTIKDRDEVRAAILGVVRDRPTDTAWPIPYAVRRIAWHVLDHLWEIEDKST